MSLVILPSVDLRAGRVVRLKQGDYAQQLNYDVDPIQTARSFADAGAQWMHLVDLDGAKDGRPAQTDLISRMIAATGLNVQVGGGIRETQHIQTLLALDAKDGVVATRGWTQSSGKLAVDLARQVTDWPLAAILYTDVAKDGMMSGPNIEQTRKLAVAGKVPVIASGGVGSIDHIRKLTQIPAWGVIVGRSLYEGAVDLRQALAAGAGPV
jgi:phosphoribosylformimino-5-aminoimidazole carboxamide ribotide isomerase